MGLISRVSSRTYRSNSIMPPKKDSNKTSKKTKEKKKAQSIEDKTFGLKNKKGAKQQKFVEQVNRQANAQYGDKNKQKEQEQKKSKKEQRQAYLAELDSILKPIKTERKVMLSKKQQAEDKNKTVTYLTIEELVEVERLKLKNSGKKLTPVTLESFLVWKQKKKAEEEEKKNKKYAADNKKKIQDTTGKQLFAYYHDNDQVDLNDDEEAADIEYDSENEEMENELKKQGGFREITAETFYYAGVDKKINEESFQDDIDESLFQDEDLDALADELEGLQMED